MKRAFVIALLMIAAISVTSFSEAQSGPGMIFLPDGTYCYWLYDDYNSYHGWRGVYLCTTTDGYNYIGWGPPSFAPPE